MDLSPIGQIECDGRELTHIQNLKGPSIGSVKLNFEPDHLGVAIKARRREDQNLLYKTGEREQPMSQIWEIPDGYELVGFHAGMNANDEIVWLGIVTRVAIFPAVCFEAVSTIRQGVYAINDLNVVISDMSSDIQRQVGAMEGDVNEQFVQMNKDVEEQIGMVETSI